MKLQGEEGKASVMLLMNGKELLYSFLKGSFFERYEKSLMEKDEPSKILIKVPLDGPAEDFGGALIIPLTEIPDLLKVSPNTDIDRAILGEISSVS